MIDPIDGAIELGDFLTENKVDYVIIGGLAVQVWGDARLTRDADLTISSSVEEGVAPLVELITGVYESRVPDPFGFARQTRMILIKTASGIDVDISLGMPGYEEEMFSRAVEIEIRSGISLKISSPEDLIIQKAIAGRPQDASDMESIVIRQGNELDVSYVRKWLSVYAEILEDEDLTGRFDLVWKKYSGSTNAG